MALKKYSKVKFTLRKELVLILSAIVLLVVATILLNLPNKEERFLKDWNAAGSTLTENLLYEEVSFDELKDIIKEENKVFVLFATSQDATSVTVFDKVYTLGLNTFELDKVYLVDSTVVLDENGEEDAEYVAELKTTFGELTLDQTPNLWYFEAGKLAEEANQDIITEKGSDWTSEIIQIFTNSADK
jgi:hypothetical protein